MAAFGFRRLLRIVGDFGASGEDVPAVLRESSDCLVPSAVFVGFGGRFSRFRSRSARAVRWLAGLSAVETTVVVVPAGRPVRGLTARGHTSPVVLVVWWSGGLDGAVLLDFSLLSDWFCFCFVFFLQVLYWLCFGAGGGREWNRAGVWLRG